MARVDVFLLKHLKSLSAALQQLNAAVALAGNRKLSTLEQLGLIKEFEFTHELAWHVMKDYVQLQGSKTVRGACDASFEAYKLGLIDKCDIWIDMIETRSEILHCYDRLLANEISIRIIGIYCPALKAYYNKLRCLIS